MKAIKIISLTVFIGLTAFFVIWAYKSNLSFDEFGAYFGIIGSVASIIGLFISIYTLSNPKSASKNTQDGLISVKKNVIEGSSFGNIKGSINIGDNPKNNEMDK